MSIGNIDFCLACPNSHVLPGVVAVAGVGLCCAPCARRIEATGIRPEIPEGPGLPKLQEARP
jgi:hypothetical protein